MLQKLFRTLPHTDTYMYTYTLLPHTQTHAYTDTDFISHNYSKQLI